MGDASYPPRTVFGVDPGHGGSDAGARATDAGGEVVRERDIVSRIAARAKLDMPEIYLTRGSADEYVSQHERARRMRQCGAEVVVSLHCDSTPWAPEAHGTHAYYRLGDAVGRKLAGFAVKSTPAPLRPGRKGVICAHDNPDIRKDDWKRSSQRIAENYRPLPVVLIEFGYMSNEEDLDFLLSPDGVQRCADLVRAVLEHYHHLTKGA